VIAKVDKGEALIILKKNVYEKKIHDFLLQAGAIPSNLNFNTHNEQVREKIRKAQHLITGSLKSRERLYVMNPSFPKIYGQVKTHESGYPIRPVVAFYTDPTFHHDILIVLIILVFIMLIKNLNLFLIFYYQKYVLLILINIYLSSPNTLPTGSGLSANLKLNTRF